MNKKQAKILRRYITQYVNAQIEDSWKGGGDPEKIPDIEENLQNTWDRLQAYIDSLTEADQ